MLFGESDTTPGAETGCGTGVGVGGAGTGIGLGLVVDGGAVEVTPLLTTLKVTAAEAPPPGAGLLTAIDAVPSVAMLVPGTIAVMVWESTICTVSGAPFQITADSVIKLLPFTVSVTVASPARALLGVMTVMTGVGLSCASGAVLEVELAFEKLQALSMALITIVPMSDRVRRFACILLNHNRNEGVNNVGIAWISRQCLRGE